MSVYNRDMLRLTKPMRNMLIFVGLLFAFVFGYKIVKGLLITRYMETHQSNIVYVSTAVADYEEWQPQIKASGNVRAILGVNVTTELAGMVREIYFKPGAMVNKGDLLVLLDIDADMAQLRSLEANAELARVTYIRDKAQYAIKAISKATLDTDIANLKSAEALVQHQKAIIEQKTIRAPFNGRLGISLINPGQYLNPGDKITMLQTLDPIYVDFYVPQRMIDSVKIGQDMTVKVDAFPSKVFKGKITTIDPGVDPNVRNVQVEATLPNGELNLVPGMFASVVVDTGETQSLLTLPITAITFNSFGETVFIVKEKGKDKSGKSILIANQVFVSTGVKRGDQIVVLKGLKKGDVIVTSGQLKLQNGSQIAINNSVIPTNEINPQPIDE